MGKNKFLSGVVALLLAGGLILTAGIGSSGFTNWSVGDWFNRWGAGVENSSEDGNAQLEEKIGGAIFGGVMNEGIELMSAVIPCSAYEVNGISEQADTAYCLTATVRPDFTDDKSVDWSVAWQNADSEWASGKAISDYLTITPTSNGSRVANLVCKQAFGEQAVVTVIARSNAQAKATATVDYCKKLVASTYSIANQLDLSGSTSSTKTWTWERLNDTGDTGIWFKFGGFTDTFSSVGTLDDTVRSHSIEVTVSPQLKAQLASKFTSERAKEYYNSTLALRCADGNIYTWLSQSSIYGYFPNNDDVFRGLFDFVTQDYDYDARYFIMSSYTALIGCMKSSVVDFVVTVKTTLAHGGTVSTVYNVNVADNSLITQANQIDLSSSGIIF